MADPAPGLNVAARQQAAGMLPSVTGPGGSVAGRIVNVAALTMPVGRVVVLVGVVCAGVLLIVAFAYLCSAFLLSQFDVRRRVLLGESGLPAILGLNVASFILVWGFGMCLAYMSGRGLYFHATVIAVFAQAIWLAQHLRFYQRDHLRVSYEKLNQEHRPLHSSDHRPAPSFC
jgi:hypothetical protein